MKALDDAKTDLKWIRAMTGHEMGYLEGGQEVEGNRYKRSTSGLDDLLASFKVVNYYSEGEIPELINDIEGGDAWYNSFRNKECKNGGCTQRTLKYTNKARKKKNHNKGKTKKLAKDDKKDDSDEESEEDPKEDSGRDSKEDSENDNQENEYDEKVQKKQPKVEKGDPDYDDYDSSKDGHPKISNSESREKFDEENENDKNIKKIKNKNQKDMHNSFTSYNHKNFGKQRQSNVMAKEVNYDSTIFDSLQPKPSEDDSQSDPIELKDQVEKTQNDLSHEANYKLSKIEQEAMDKKARANRSWPLKHPEFQIPMLMQQKDHDESRYDTSKLVDNSRTSKRSLDPLNEFKLKVSERLMLKGLGASLPSDAIDDRTIHDYNVQTELDTNKKRDATTDNFERYLWIRSPDDKKIDESRQMSDESSKEAETVINKKSTGRKLMALTDYDLMEDFAHQEINKLENNKIQEIASKQLSRQEKNIKQIYVPSENSANDLTAYYNSKYYNDNVKNKMLSASVDNKKDQKRTSKISEDDDSLSLDLNEDLLKSSDVERCGDPSKFVKPGSKLKDIAPSMETSTTTITPKSGNNTQNQSGQNQMTFKLNIAFNASVVNGTRNSCKNSSTSKIRVFEEKKSIKTGAERNVKDKDNNENNDDEPIVQKRYIIFPPLPSEVSKRTNEAISKSIAKSIEESPIDCILSGKLTAQLVNAVFRLVESNDNFRAYILPGLKTQKLKACSGCNNLNAIKNEKNCDQINRSEQMLRQVMETISAIIEQQVRTRTCIPLCTKLKKFYNLIMKSRSENEKIIRSTRQRKARERSERSHYLTKRESSPEPKVRQKYSVVKKLLNQYGYLPAEDQEKSKDIRDMLQMHLVYLKELEMQDMQRRKRGYFANKFLNLKNTIKSRDTEGDEISPRFMKLVRVSELIRKSSLMPENADYTMLQDYDYL